MALRLTWCTHCGALGRAVMSGSGAARQWHTQGEIVMAKTDKPNILIIWGDDIG